VVQITGNEAQAHNITWSFKKYVCRSILNHHITKNIWKIHYLLRWW